MGVHLVGSWHESGRRTKVVDGYFESGRRPLSPQLATKCTSNKIQISIFPLTPNRYFIVQWTLKVVDQLVIRGEGS
jgi:hypothetical protein